MYDVHRDPLRTLIHLLNSLKKTVILKRIPPGYSEKVCVFVCVCVCVRSAFLPQEGNTLLKISILEIDRPIPPLPPQAHRPSPFTTLPALTKVSALAACLELCWSRLGVTLFRFGCASTQGLGSWYGIRPWSRDSAAPF